MSDVDDDDLCPLCMEALDLTDKNFIPCQCGYQVCLWCWHHIKENINGLCPACRTPYADQPVVAAKLDRDELVRRSKQRKLKEKKQSTKTIATATFDRKSLTNVRVIQRNLVYVIGLSPSLAKEEVLRRPEFFGQYGRIVKVVVNRNHVSGERGHGSASAYITFARKEDASAAIQAVDGFWLDNRLLRASFGTTKYCNYFLRNLPCNNPDCLYLHELGDNDDSFTKEEMQAGKAISGFREQNGTQTLERSASFTGPRATILPPPPSDRDVQGVVEDASSAPATSPTHTSGAGAAFSSSGSSPERRSPRHTSDVPAASPPKMPSINAPTRNPWGVPAQPVAAPRPQTAEDTEFPSLQINVTESGYPTLERSDLARGSQVKTPAGIKLERQGISEPPTNRRTVSNTERATGENDGYRLSNSCHLAIDEIRKLLKEEIGNPSKRSLAWPQYPFAAFAGVTLPEDYSSGNVSDTALKVACYVDGLQVGIFTDSDMRQSKNTTNLYDPETLALAPLGPEFQDSATAALRVELLGLAVSTSLHSQEDSRYNFACETNEEDVKRLEIENPEIEPIPLPFLTKSGPGLFGLLGASSESNHRQGAQHKQSPVFIEGSSVAPGRNIAAGNPSQIYSEYAQHSGQTSQSLFNSSPQLGAAVSALDNRSFEKDGMTDYRGNVKEGQAGAVDHINKALTSDLAWLQQQLPNVNITFGNGATTAGLPSRLQQSRLASWAGGSENDQIQLSHQAAPKRPSSPVSKSRGQSSPAIPFQDPAIVMAGPSFPDRAVSTNLASPQGSGTQRMFPFQNSSSQHSDNFSVSPQFESSSNASRFWQGGSLPPGVVGHTQAASL